MSDEPKPITAKRDRFEWLAELSTRGEPLDWAAHRRVWVAYDEDLSHGIQQILGVFSTEAKAREAAKLGAEHQGVVEEFEVDD